MTYHAPLQDMKLVLQTLCEIQDADIMETVLTEAARLAENVWAPTNRLGDQKGTQFIDGTLQAPPVFKEAYQQFAAGGWNAMTWPEEFGGQNLPFSLAMAANEMWQSANLALGLCPLLTHAAIEAIHTYGTSAQKQTYLPSLISGEWTGTMHLTEPQAGSDLGAIKTTAQKSGEGYLLKGQKIFITWGDHDMTKNIVHLVLAHMEGLPHGNEGLGLFIVPKILSNGERNDVKAVSIEHKLGIHGSPTCVMVYGDEGGAKAELLGEAGKGLRNMFTMMNAARISVGLQGVAMSARAYQHACRYARERVQGMRLGDKSGQRVPIIRHPDVRRMLMTLKAQTEAARALTYYAGGMIDKMHAGISGAAARIDLLTPLVKAWSTDLAVENASLALQVHGGMGYVEETGAAQYYRDARILPIYEGTNGIQSQDLVFRKVIRDQGAETFRFLNEIKTFLNRKEALYAELSAAVSSVEVSTQWILKEVQGGNLESVAVGAAVYQRQFAMVAAGYLMARLAEAVENALEKGDGDVAFLKAKIKTIRFFFSGILPQAQGLTFVVQGGCNAALEIEEDQIR